MCWTRSTNKAVEGNVEFGYFISGPDLRFAQTKGCFLVTGSGSNDWAS